MLASCSFCSISSNALRNPGCSSAFEEAVSQRESMMIPNEAHVFEIKLSLPSDVCIGIDC